MKKFVRDALKKNPNGATHAVIYDDTQEVSFVKKTPHLMFYSEALKMWLDGRNIASINKNKLHRL